MTGKRKRYTAEFKAKVALEAPRGELTAAQLAARHGIHQTMAGEWKRQAMEGLTSVFSGKAEAAEAAQPAEVEKLHAKIGQPVVERGFFRSAKLAGTPAAPGRPSRRRDRGGTGRAGSGRGGADRAAHEGPSSALG